MSELNLSQLAALYKDRVVFVAERIKALKVELEDRTKKQDVNFDNYFRKQIIDADEYDRIRLGFEFDVLEKELAGFIEEFYFNEVGEGEKRRMNILLADLKENYLPEKLRAKYWDIKKIMQHFGETVDVKCFFERYM